jgi:hypothetical protein
LPAICRFNAPQHLPSSAFMALAHRLISKLPPASPIKKLQQHFNPQATESLHGLKPRLFQENPSAPEL